MLDDACVSELATGLCARRWLLCVAESCTGGAIAARLTALPGSSAWFDRGFVAYSHASKRDLLQVQHATLERHGSVSEPAVAEMAGGALGMSEADVALAVSGIAGPGGGSAQKPVGTVCFAWLLPGTQVQTRTHCFDGDRAAIREQTIDFALQGLLDRLHAHAGP